MTGPGPSLSLGPGGLPHLCRTAGLRTLEHLPPVDGDPEHGGECASRPQNTTRALGSRLSGARTLARSTHPPHHDTLAARLCPRSGLRAAPRLTARNGQRTWTRPAWRGVGRGWWPGGPRWTDSGSGLGWFWWCSARIGFGSVLRAGHNDWGAWKDGRSHGVGRGSKNSTQSEPTDQPTRPKPEPGQAEPSLPENFVTRATRPVCRVSVPPIEHRGGGGEGGSTNLPFL